MVVCMTQFSSMLYLLVKSVSRSGTWTMTYVAVAQHFRLSVCRKFLTMYNIVSGHMYFPSSIFVQVIYHTSLIAQAHSTLLDFCA